MPIFRKHQMKPELESQIYDASPVFFGEKDLDMTQTCMCWGIECGDGWFKPVLEFAKGVKVLNDILAPLGFAVICSQMKSKWADFTCYWNIKPVESESSSRELDEKDQNLIDTVYHMMDSLVGQTVFECSRTCEICGERGVLDGDVITCGSWLTVKCHKCAQERQRKEGVIYNFRDGFEFLSPFSEDDGKIVVDGVGYSSFLGAYYGTLRPEHSSVFEGMSHPNDVQNCAIGMGIQEASARAVEIMRKVLRCRYSMPTYSSKKRKEELVSVAGLEIEWRNWTHENFWGRCMCQDCKEKEFHNHYGRILMELAEEFKNSSSKQENEV